MLGLWVIVAPWTIAHLMVGPQSPFGVPAAAMLDHYVVGVLVAIFAVVALMGFKAWEEWVNVVLGAGLGILPWLFGFSATAGAGLTWNALIVGILIILFAGWTLADVEGPTTVTK